MYSIAPREGFEDAALGFEILGSDDKGKVEPKTDWVIRRSFPVFAMNVIRYLGGLARGGEMSTVKPGQPMVLRTESTADRIAVQRPDGQRAEVLAQTQNQFVFTNTDQLGIYSVFEGRNAKPARQFAVNLFDSRESDLQAASQDRTGARGSAGQRRIGAGAEGAVAVAADRRTWSCWSSSGTSTTGGCTCDSLGPLARQ